MMAYPNTQNLFPQFLVLILILIPSGSPGLRSNILFLKKLVLDKFPF